MRWREEIDEFHAFLEAYFLGVQTSLRRAEAALAPGFTIVGAHGAEVDRAATLQTLLEGHGHSASLSITTSDHRLILEHHDVVVASYIEHHQLSERTNERHSTVVFVPEVSAPNGLLWLRVHETWLSQI